MNDPLVDRLRAQMGGPRDGALLRFSIGNALLGEGRYLDAAAAFRESLSFDADYSAAWKLLGKALLAVDDEAGAADAWSAGVAASTRRGDIQAGKEMTVFLNRLRRK